MIKGSAITLALFLVYLSLPLFGMLPGLLAPSACAYYLLKDGRAAGYGILAVSLGILGAYDAASAAVYFLQCGILSVCLAECLSRNYGGSRSVVYSVTVNLVALLAAAAIYSSVTGNNLHYQVVKGINTSISQTVSLYGKAGVGGSDLASLRQSMEQAGTFIARTYPALITVSLCLIAGINLLLLRKLSARFSLPLFLGEFKRFKNPDQLVWVLIIAGFAMLVETQYVSLPALNLLIVVAAAYFIQGMAVMAHAFERFSVPLFIRLIFYLLLSLQPFLTLVVAALGIFDLWGDFRTPKNKQNL